MSSYLESSTELIKALTSLFQSITLWKFLRWAFSILMIFALSLFVYEKFISSSFYYEKLERKLILIEKVKKLTPNDSLVNSAVNKNLLKILNELNPPENDYLQSIHIDLYNLPTKGISTILLKLIGASLLPLVIIISSRGEPNRKSTVTGAILFILFFGVIAIFIPIIYNIWLNIIIMPFIELLFLMPFMLKSSNR